MSNSIGNLKNSGLQGNNFPWQLKMLIGQECICDQLKLANDILQDIGYISIFGFQVINAS